MNPNEVQSLLSWAAETAKLKGASASDFILNKQSSISLGAQQKKLDKYKVSSSHCLGVRVLKDHRVGLYYTENLDKPAILEAIEGALTNTRYSDPDTDLSIQSETQDCYLEDNPDIYQEEKTSLEAKIQFALELETRTFDRDKRVTSCPYNGYSEGEIKHYYSNHQGRFCYHRERSLGCYTSAVLSEGDNQSMYWGSSNARNFTGLDSDYCIDETFKHAVPLLGAKPIQTGDYDIIFTPDTLKKILGCFMGLFSAQAVLENKSAFKGKLEQSIASDLLTITDCPTYAKSYNFIKFDDEGIQKQDFCFLDKGILKQFFHNTYTASKLGTHTTAHASRSPKGTLGIGTGDLVIQPGQTDLETVQQGTSLEIIDLAGLHSGTDPISGDFSLGISGYLRENGEIQQCFKGNTLSGNFFELLKQIKFVGNNEISDSDKSFFTPTIRFSGAKIAG